MSKPWQISLNHLLQIPSTKTLGSTLPSVPKNFKISHQAFPHDGSTRLKWPAPACPPVTGNHHGAGAKGAAGRGSQRWEFLGWHRGYLVCLDLPLWRFLLTKLYHFRCYRKNNYKIFTKALLCCWGGQIFSHQFLVIAECPTPSLGRDLSLPSKSCRYCSPLKRCFKTLLWEQTNDFYQPPSEITPELERPFMAVWPKNPQISNSTEGKSRPDYNPLWYY